MSVLRVQHILKFDTGLPSDVAVTTWHFGTDGTDDPGDAVFAANAVKAFFDTPGTGGLRLRNRLASTVDPSVTGVKVYRLNDAIPRVPLHDETYDMGGVGADALPAEVACCLSFQVAKVSGELQRRKRGRVFLGPLAQGAVQITSGRVVITPEMRNILTVAADVMHDYAATNGISWVVYSRANGLGATRAVHDVWVDDAPDTIRRRGFKPTTRETLVVA